MSWKATSTRRGSTGSGPGVEEHGGRPPGDPVGEIRRPQQSGRHAEALPLRMPSPRRTPLERPIFEEEKRANAGALETAWRCFKERQGREDSPGLEEAASREGRGPASASLGRGDLEGGSKQL